MELDFFLLLPYITPRCSDASKMKIPTKSCAPLVKPIVPKGVNVLKNILLNQQKLSFIDHDTKKQKDLDRKNYKLTVQDTSDSPKRFVPMEWARTRPI